MAECLLDANILIGVFRGEGELKTFVEGLDSAIDTTVYIELIQGAKNKREVELIEKALGQFKVLHFNESVSRRSIDLIKAYSKSHGLLLGDSLVAATCLENGLELITFNAKDFRFIEGLKIRVPKL
ncbi:MAG: type II toxin-antitoxin system VapC family toxin [Pyrinomonadaceae bacterium]